MASITIRNLDDGVKDLLRQLAAENGCSMEEQARAMIRAAVEGRAGQADRIDQIEKTLRA
ncbi:MAG: bifunctional phosphopantothenoylcysteine decarboxylase/phosphopantothenate synthase, partial [Mesorhizobium sp.]